MSDGRRAGPTAFDVSTIAATSAMTPPPAQGATRLALGPSDDHITTAAMPLAVIPQRAATRDPDIQSAAMFTTNTRKTIALATPRDRSSTPWNAPCGAWRREFRSASNASGPASAAHRPIALASSNVPVARILVAQNGVLRNPKSIVA